LLGFLFLILGESEPDYDLEAPLISEPELVWVFFLEDPEPLEDEFLFFDDLTVSEASGNTMPIEARTSL
jgi:hypothetical protein